MLIALAVWGGHAHALGLGAIALQSGLGQPLQARIPVYGLGADEAGANCVKSRVLALEGGLLSRPVAEVTGSGAASVLKLRTVESIGEPAINVSVEIGCTNSVKREYQVLLDPVPATLPMAAPMTRAPTERPERAQRKAASQAGIVAAPVDPETSIAAGSKASVPPTPKPLAIVAHKPAAPAKPKPAAEPKSVLTLAGGDTEIEQGRARVALRSATVLSEPRVETDPARLAASRADQARVAALLRGEDPLAGTQAQLRAAQENLLAVQKAAASAARLHEQEKAAIAAAQEGMVSGRLLAVLGALLLACVAAIAWLLWRRADDRRRQEQAFFAMPAEQDASSAMPLQHQNEGQTQARQPLPAFAQPAAPVLATSTEAESLDFAMPADEVVPAPAPAPSVSHPFHDWRAEAGTPIVATTPPESLQLPESWMSLENHDVDGSAQASRSDQLPSPVSRPNENANDNAHAHAAEVANMLMAAESWMAEHNPMRAAGVLQPYLARDEMQSPAPALYLLSLYRTMDDKGQIATVLAQLEQDFPAQAAAWNDPGHARRSIADFPLVHAAVDSLSDSATLLPYLNSLLLAPEQFDFSTYREIVRAIGLAHEMKQDSDLQSMSLDFQ